MGVQETDPLAQLSLPPGFRFYPTDEELLVQYLCKKIAGHDFALPIIGDIDLYKFDPWVLPGKAKFGEKEWYFFSPRDRKYPNGSRPNRVAGSGYWKATGTDKIITSEGRKVGIKKALVFYVGKAPKGTKTNWIMHEYRLSESPKKNGSARLDEWVLCRIYKKHSSGQKAIISEEIGSQSKEFSHGSSTSSSSQFDDMLDTFPEINDRSFTLPRMNSLKTTTFQHQDDQKQQLNLQSFNSGSFDWINFAGINSFPELIPQPGQTQPAINNTNNTINYRDDMVVPTVPQMCQGGVVEQEVESGLRAQRVNNSGLMFNTNASFTPNYSNSVDPFGIRYPTQPGNFGFRQ